VEKALYPITVLCRVLGVSPSGFHAWAKRPPSRHALEDARLAAHVVASHERSRRTYGSTRILRDLRDEGVRTSRKRVDRLMPDRGLRARPRRRSRRTTDSSHGKPVAPNVLGRMFRATAPNVAWVTDVTAIPTGEGWTYLAVVIDLFSRRTVGWATGDVNDTTLAVEALSAATRLRRPAAGLIHHSDRGSPYASEAYRTELARLGSVASMSRKGDCWDNAVAESFFSTLTFELLDRTNLTTREHARNALGDYIENFYNLRRRHSTVDDLSPIEFELRSASIVEAASSTCPPKRG
jgi:transposase InsO family protein